MRTSGSSDRSSSETVKAGVSIPCISGFTCKSGIKYAAGFLRLFFRISSVSFSKASLLSCFNAATGRKISPWISASSSVKIKSLSPVLVICFMISSLERGRFLAGSAKAPGTSTSSSPEVIKSLAHFPGEIIIFPLIFSFDFFFRLSAALSFKDWFFVRKIRMPGFKCFSFCPFKQTLSPFFQISGLVSSTFSPLSREISSTSPFPRSSAA